MTTTVKKVVVIMFGGLHIEMAALRSIGIQLQDRNLIGTLLEAGVNKITWQMYQITACSLNKLSKAAYTYYYNGTDHSDSKKNKLSFETQLARVVNYKAPVSVRKFGVADGTGDLSTNLIVQGSKLQHVLSVTASTILFVHNNVSYAHWFLVT